MPRTMLTDEQWQTLKEILFKEKFIYNKFDLRNTFEDILYRMRTGIQWRDLPAEFGRWNTIFKRFNVRSKKEILQKIFKLFSSDNDPEWLFIDGSIVKAHQNRTATSMLFSR
ncbi:MAG: transposase [Aliivibrio sp.]|nr:transposase [Aliivibrio sp.]